MMIDQRNMLGCGRHKINRIIEGGKFKGFVDFRSL